MARTNKVWERTQAVHLPKVAAALGQERPGNFYAECVTIVAVAGTKKAVVEMLSAHTDRIDATFVVMSMQARDIESLAAIELRGAGVDLSEPAVYAVGRDIAVRLDADGAMATFGKKAD